MAQCQWSMHMLVSVQLLLLLLCSFLIIRIHLTRTCESSSILNLSNTACSILTPGPIEDGAFLKLRRTDDSIFYIKLYDSTLSARPRSLTWIPIRFYSHDHAYKVLSHNVWDVFLYVLFFILGIYWCVFWQINGEWNWYAACQFVRIVAIVLKFTTCIAITSFMCNTLQLHLRLWAAK